MFTSELIYSKNKPDSFFSIFTYFTWTIETQAHLALLS